MANLNALQFERVQTANPDRIETMAKIFFRLFRDEHPVDQAGAAETILATLISKNARSLADAVRGADEVADDIRDTIHKTWRE
jgi:hypothetical protein